MQDGKPKLQTNVSSHSVINSYSSVSFYTELTNDNIHENHNDEGGDADVDVVAPQNCAIEDPGPVDVRNYLNCSKIRANNYF